MREIQKARADQYKSPIYIDAKQRVAMNVRRMRAERGWSQEKCVEKCGEMPLNVLRQVESATANLTLVTLARLSMGFEVDIAALFEPAEPFEKRKRGRPKKGEDGK